MTTPDSTLATAIQDLRENIDSLCLGSITDAVSYAAQAELIVNWNDNLDRAEGDEPIDEDAELAHYGLERPTSARR